MKLGDLIFRNIGILILLLLVAVFVGMVSPVWATDDCRGNRCNGGDVDVNTDFTIGGDTTLTAGDNTASNSTHIGGGRALALSNGLGDVDIAGCLGSTQWATPLFSKQKLSVNWACLSEFYLRTGKYKLAAIAMCNTEIAKEFETEEDCRSAHDFEPQEVVIEPASDDRDEAEDRYRVEQQMAYDSLRMEIEELKAKKAARPQTIVQKTEFLDAEKRSKLEALRGDK